MLKIIKYIIVTLLILFTSSSLLIGWPVINLYNDYLSAKYLSSLENITLPKNSKVINSFKQFGILEGNSNHCDCSIAVIIESDMKIKEFENYVNTSLSLNTPFSNLGKKHSNIYYVENHQLFWIHQGGTTVFIDNNYFDYANNKSFEFYINKNEYHALKNMIAKTPQKDNKNHFIITAFDQTYTRVNMKDYRCH